MGMDQVSTSPLPVIYRNDVLNAEFPVPPEIRDDLRA
jgi:hypothetical protein